MILPSKIKFVDEKLKEAFEKLEESKEKQMYKFIVRAFEDIENNSFTGIQIPKKLIPKEYVQKYEIKNLWKYDLPNAWRLLYSIERDELIVVSIVLEWLDHKSYEKRFNY
ncbi:hypothetical protein CL617_02975 [archaeon]|nr:hypothetical protein [archaeon]|tara:strand:- start:10467 stop:10796 length:330 start_codon:yes stop_codon:yes gene_type:complete